jgi:hypothetical protein
MKCICCSKKIKSLHKFDDKENLENNMWDDGCVDVIIPGYGSKYDMTVFYICVCDECIEKKLKEKILTIKVDYNGKN